jgi:hypothetical protein
MTNKMKTLSLVVASALLSSTAFSQITFSGYNETSYQKQGRKALNQANEAFTAARSGTQLGNETVLTARGASKLPNGNNVSAYANFYDTDALVGGERGFDIGLSKDVSFVYGFDRVFGAEMVRTFTPFATNRITDVTGHAAAANLVDVTSEQHAIGLNANNVGMEGLTLSIAYNPNRTSGAIDTTSSDRLDALAKASDGYGIGIRTPSIQGLTFGAGITKIDLKAEATSDITSKTIGAQYTMAPFAIGIQRTKTDGTGAAPDGAAVLANTDHEDTTDVVSGTYAVSKEVTAGLGYSTMERTRNGIASAVDAKVILFSLAYNLGPVVLSLDHERVSDSSTGANVNNIAGNDSSMSKLKARVNF